MSWRWRPWQTCSRHPAVGRGNERKQKPHKKEKQSMTAKDQGETSGDEQRLIRQLAELLNETGLSEIEI